MPGPDVTGKRRLPAALRACSVVDSVIFIHHYRATSIRGISKLSYLAKRLRYRSV